MDRKKGVFTEGWNWRKSACLVVVFADDILV
jgi:hypothetical protein